MIKLTEIIDYLDQPILFVGKDGHGNQYLAVLLDEEESKYVAVIISKERLKKFLADKISLRSIYKNPETHEFYVIGFTNGEDYKVERTLSHLTEEYLPAE